MQYYSAPERILKISSNLAVASTGCSKPPERSYAILFSTRKNSKNLVQPCCRIYRLFRNLLFFPHLNNLRFRLCVDRPDYAILFSTRKNSKNLVQPCCRIYRLFRNLLFFPHLNNLRFRLCVDRPDPETVLHFRLFFHSDRLVA